METKLRDRTYRASCASLGIYSASVIALPICLVAISKELGFSLTQSGALGLFASVVQFVMLISSSFFAARFGKIRVIRGGLVVLAAGLVLFILSKSWIHAALLMLVIGAGSALLDALLTPIVEDLYPKDDGSKMNLLHAFWPVGTLVSVLLLGQLLTIGVSWRYLFTGIAVVMLLVMFWFPSSRKIRLPANRTDFSHMGEILCSGGSGSSDPRSDSPVVPKGLLPSGLRVTYSFLLTSSRAGAFGTAAFALGMAIGRFSSSRIAGKIGLRRLIIISLLCGVLVSGGFFFVRNLFTLYAFLAVIGLCIATLWPSIQSYAGSQLAVDPTILMIFLSCFGLPGFNSATFIMGVIGDRWGLRASFIVAPVYILFALILMLIDRRLGKKSVR